MMVLLSRESDLKMFAELVPITRTLNFKEVTLSFELEKEITENHEISVMFENKEKRTVFFITSSFWNPDYEEQR